MCIRDRYYVDAQMLRLIPVKTQIPQMSTQKMAQRVVDELVEGYDDNPKIRRIIPNVKHGIKAVSYTHLINVTYR